MGTHACFLYMCPSHQLSRCTYEVRVWSTRLSGQEVQRGRLLGRKLALSCCIAERHAGRSFALQCCWMKIRCLKNFLLIQFLPCCNDRFLLLGKICWLGWWQRVLLPANLQAADISQILEQLLPHAS